MAKDQFNYANESGHEKLSTGLYIYVFYYRFFYLSKDRIRSKKPYRRIVYSNRIDRW